MYWFVEEGFCVALVAKCMLRKRFDDLIRFLHFKDNQNLDHPDKMTKLRPLTEQLNKKFVMTYPLDQQLLYLDEAMIGYFGRHGANRVFRTNLCGLDSKLDA